MTSVWRVGSWPGGFCWEEIISEEAWLSEIDYWSQVPYYGLGQLYKKLRSKENTADRWGSDGFLLLSITLEIKEETYAGLSINPADLSTVFIITNKRSSSLFDSDDSEG